MIQISAVILAKNEGERIEKCLESLSWVDEIVVVDNGSSDDTKEISLKHKAIVITEKSEDFAALRNIGASKAKGDWLLYVDADEVVTKELKEEIQKAVSCQLPAVSTLVNGYEICRKNYYLGHEWPGDERIVRLMRRDALKGWQGKLHETAIVNGKIGILSAPIVHYTHRTLEEMVAKTNQWSEIEAKLRLDAHHPKIVWWRLLRVMTTAFYDSFIKQGGWRAGTVGWVESIYQAFSMFITYAKLWELQQRGIQQTSEFDTIQE